MADTNGSPFTQEMDREVMKAIKKFIPLIIILGLMGLAYFTGLGEYLSFESLKEHRSRLKDLVNEYPSTAPILYMIVYAISTALSIPGGLFLSIFGGFLFPQPYSTIYVVTGATIGAICIFLAASTALGGVMREKAGGMLDKMRAGFQENGWSYLLFLRLVPIFPFWLVNIAPAFFGVSLQTFAWTTFVGIIPGAFVFTQAGTGLGAILDAGNELSIDAIFNNDIKIALVALGIFALLPVVIKKFRKN